MGNNLHRIEKDLRSIAKRYKSVKYSIGLAILFLMLGVSAFSEEVNTKTQVAQIATREELKTSVGDVQTKLNVLRDNNKKEIKNLNLELVQLMEQGTQVVKSPWASWQFGMNFFYENWGGTYKGSGDKPQKYIYNAVHTRGDWKVKNAMDTLDARKVSSTPLTPGNDSLASWIDILNTLSGVGKVEKDSALYSSTNGRRTWGLVDLLNIKEPINEVEILARISPKEVNKQAIPLTIDEPVVEGIEAPKVEPNVNTPLKAPEIKLPEISEIVISSLEINPPDAPSISLTINAPSAPIAPSIEVSPGTPGTVEIPNISINVTPPTITALAITTPPTVTVTPPTVSTIEPVAFSVAPTIDPHGQYKKNTQTGINGLNSEINIGAIKDRNYITINSAEGKLEMPAEKTFNVNANNNRALVIDESKNGLEFTSNATINLNKSQNMGIDLQGTHGNGMMISSIINNGKIIGHEGPEGARNRQQIAFGFSNADASGNNTMTNMVNTGTITLNAPSSAGMQLKPEDPHYWLPNWGALSGNNKMSIVGFTTENGSIKQNASKYGKVLMKADNRNDINLNGSGSFGIITVFNPGIIELDTIDVNRTTYTKEGYNLRSQRKIGANVLPGGEIGRSALADSKYTSGVYNTGTININGDESVGVGILHEIQEVKVGGTINIGTGTVNQVKNVSDTKSTATSDQTKVVNNAVGVFAGVPTLPVKAGENDTMGNKNTTGATIGTETTEANGKINLGKNATGSIGLLVGDSAEDLNKGSLNGVANQVRQLLRSGSITYKASTDGKINVDGNENYGFVVNSESYSSEFKGALDDLTQSKNNKTTHGRGINEGKIEVVGTKSIGFALLKGGDSENTGSITVGEPAENSIGFYGEQDKFTNKGTIAVNTPSKTGNKAVLLKGNTNGINFDNTGTISVEGNSNIGVYAEGKYTFNHEKNAAGDNKISVGSNAIGIYAKNATGALNIKAPIDIAASGTGTNAGTTIGIYTDGDAKVKFGDNSKLTIGEGAVGLYSSDATKFNNTFEIETGKKLEVELGKKSTFALLNGATATDVPLSKYLNNGTTDKIEITQFSEGASLFYATSNAKAVLDKDYTVTNGTAASTSVLVANDGASVKIASGKKLETNTNVGLIANANGAVAENEGTLESTRTEKGIGIYTTFATGKNSGTITMDNKEAVGMLATIGSTLINSSKIELKGISSAGMYGENSDLTNSGNASNITVNKEASAGMYAKMTKDATAVKVSKNEGTIQIKADGAGKSAAMYSLMENGTNKVMTTKNTKDIEVAQKTSAGIYVKNESAQDKNNSLAENTGSIKMTGESSVGIIAEKSKVTNSGTGANGIEISGNNSAGILATKESEVTNSGRIEGNTGIKLVGISVDETSTVTNTVSGTIIMNTAQNTGIASKGGQVTNSGTITLVKNNSTGISAENADVINSAGAKIEVKDKESVGIYAKMSGDVDKKVTNTGTISLETNTGTPDKSAAIYSLVDGGTRILTTENNGTINVDQTNSVGIFAQNNGTANTRSVVKNTKIINVSKEGSAGILGEKSTITNSGVGTKDGIVLTAKKTAGIIGKKDSVVNNTGRIETNTATPTVATEGLVGISLSESTAINSGSIVLDTAHSTGIFGEENSKIINDKIGTIELKKDGNVGIYSNSNIGEVINKGVITAIGTASAGISIKLEDTIGNKNVAGKNTGTIEIKGTKSAAMLGLIDSKTTVANSKLALENSGEIKIGTNESVGMMVTNNSTTLTKDKVTATNSGTIKLESTNAGDKKNIGILANEKATGINEGTIQVKTLESVGMLGQAASEVINRNTINLIAEKGIGMLATDANSTAVNDGDINVTGKKSSGMLAKEAGKAENKKNINVTAENGVGIFVSDTGEGINTTTTGKITLDSKNAVGIFAQNNGAGYTAQNAGKIILGKEDGTSANESLIGMFAQSETGKKSSVQNTGTIDVNTKKSVGMYAKNDATNVGDVDLHNAGTININNKSSAGIYAPKATVSKVGTIKFKDTDKSDGSSAVYISKGGKVSDTSTATIDLGKTNQNRVAYYVNGAGSALAGANIGKISGYGVGVYLQGDATDPNVGKAKINDTNIPKLDFKDPSLGTTGNGIIGLYLNGDTEIKDYTKGITVGDSDGTKYAIGIYANAQKITETTPGTVENTYRIITPIKVGADGVGIYADKNSDITYTGNMEVGNGTKSGTGIYITKKDGTGTATGTVTLGSNTIKLKGTGGVAVIASEGTKFDAKNATIELIGKNVTGVGVYGLKGSDVKTGGWTFKNNGNQAEEVRLVEGKVHVTSSKSLNPRMVLTHVINGETSVGTGATVTSVNDSPHTAKENIGLMAEGVKNPTAPTPLTWDEGAYEAVNKGTIDFSAAERSTAIYVNSARAKNDGTIKVGKNSIAIYGFYDKNTRKYDGATGNPNKLEVETTAASKITLGDQSTGMYLINAEKINNTGGEITSTTGAKRNVGIYAVNGQDADNDNNKVLTMTTATKMTLGDGAVGIYSKGQSNTVRNTVTNTGDITVGDKIVASKTENYPAVAVYAENTNLTNTSAIRVGNDGIAYYGKNSTINANGSVDFSNKGVLAYLENSVFISKLGNLGATQNTMLYLKDSTAQLDGAGTKVDIDVADGYTGAYISGNSHLTGVRTIKLGQGSTGLYLENTSPNFVSTAESILGTKDNARGIVAKNANFTNNSKISLSGKESVGIYSNADATKNVVNNGELTLSGKKTLGVFLRGGQTFENKANINIADSANSLEPTIGIYTAEGTSNIKHTTGTIEVGEKSIGIYSKTPSSVEMNGGKIHVKDQGIGIYKEDGTVVVKGELDIDKHVATAKDTEPTGVYAVNGATVVDQASKITVEEKSYGFILNNTDPNKTNVYTNTNAGSVSLGNDSVFLYSKGKANITNNRNINSNNSDHLIGFYIKDGGEFVNNGIIDFSTGKGNIGVYAPNGKATNRGSIVVGPTDDIDPATGKVYSDANKIVYGIGMAADNGGHIINEGDIRISTNKSIGMYGAGAGTIVENTGRILLDGSQATATNKIQSLTGVYVDEGATFKNSGLITTTDSYAGRNGKINENVSGLTGVAVMNGSTLINEATGKILIDADNSTGVVIRGKRDAAGNLVRNAVIKNYGEIRVRGKGGSAISWKDVSAAEIAELERQINSLISTDPSGNEITQASGTSKDYQGITITVKNGQATFLRNGVPVSDSEVEKINKLIGNKPNLAMSDIGFYIDTLGRTRPVTFDGVAPPVNSQLIIGTEFSEMTNKKEWIVSGDVIKPFLDQIQGRNFKITTMAGSLTWMATPILDNYGQIVGMAMSKLAYTSFVRPEDNAYNFADGLEQRYDMNALDSAEKRLFNKLNGIGKNEDVLLTQAYDEMMGHQYANVQQRIQATGRILDKEFSYLRNSWSNPSKDSNKVKTFGMKGEYKTDTAGIIDYKNNAYGVAYVHEDETVKLGESTGWYTGIVHNTFKFEDIGKSKEEQLQAKVGLFRSVPFDDNNSLNWTISGDIFVGHNKLNRRFLVVDEIFQAKSKYYTYGIGVKNEVGKEFRLSEGLSVRPYGALRVEYGRMSKIKEKSGEMKLEVKENDYLSIRPEIGTELAYKYYFGTKSLTASVGLAYENELGRVANGKNKARVAGTTADWFNIRGEKEDRKGNVKVDLNVGLDNQRFGVTGNVGYDTKGSNVRGGVGLRVIF